jgi:hypothetical protein
MVNRPPREVHLVVRQAETGFLDMLTKWCGIVLPLLTLAWTAGIYFGDEKETKKIQLDINRIQKDHADTLARLEIGNKLRHGVFVDKGVQLEMTVTSEPAPGHATHFNLYCDLSNLQEDDLNVLVTMVDYHWGSRTQSCGVGVDRVNEFEASGSFSWNPLGYVGHGDNENGDRVYDVLRDLARPEWNNRKVSLGGGGTGIVHGGSHRPFEEDFLVTLEPGTVVGFHLALVLQRPDWSSGHVATVTGRRTAVVPVWESDYWNKPTRAQ